MHIVYTICQIKKQLETILATSEDILRTVLSMRAHPGSQTAPSSQRSIGASPGQVVPQRLMVSLEEYNIS